MYFTLWTQNEKIVLLSILRHWEMSSCIQEGVWCRWFQINRYKYQVWVKCVWICTINKFSDKFRELVSVSYNCRNNLYWNWLHRETYDYTSWHSSWSMINYFYLFHDMNKTNELTVLKIAQQVFLNLLKRKMFSLVAPRNYFLRFFNDSKLPVIKCSNSKVDFTNTCVFIYLSISWKLYKSIVKRAAELDTVQFWTANCIIWIDSSKTLRCKEVSRPSETDWKDWVSFICSIFVPKFEKELFGELQIAKTS